MVRGWRGALVALMVLIAPCASAQDAAVRPTPIPNPEETPIALKIYKHFRFKDGEVFVPGPTPTPMIDLAAEADRLLAQAKAAVQEVPDLKDVLQGAFQAPEIGACRADETHAADMPTEFPEGLEGEKSPSFDMLFMEAKDVPEEYMTIFGVTTLVVPFVREQPNIGWQLIDDLGVPCLPYRVRFQGKRVYTDSGLNALKNYAKSHKGEFHPYIKDKYQIQ